LIVLHNAYNCIFVPERKVKLLVKKVTVTFGVTVTLAG
jgi:hypothetical protein